MLWKRETDFETMLVTTIYNNDARKTMIMTFQALLAEPRLHSQKKKETTAMHFGTPQPCAIQNFVVVHPSQIHCRLFRSVYYLLTAIFVFCSPPFGFFLAYCNTRSMWGKNPHPMRSSPRDNHIKNLVFFSLSRRTSSLK